MTEGEGFKNAVAEIKHAYDIRDYIEAAGVTLKPAGAGRWKGLCPFHDEKTPSFTVDESFQNYRCFGCGASGDLITFTQEHDGLGFMDALTMLASDKGIVIPDNKNKKDDTPSVDYAALRECVRAAANYFWTQYRNLPEEHPAVREVTSRGLNPNSGMYGYAPEGRTDLYQHLKSKGFSDDTITTTGVCSRTERGSIIDFWSGRLIFYIQDTMGKVVGFSGRRLYDTDFKQGKYVNSPATPLFHKSKILYNLPQARKNLKTSSTGTVRCDRPGRIRYRCGRCRTGDSIHTRARIPMPPNGWRRRPDRVLFRRGPGRDQGRPQGVHQRASCPLMRLCVRNAGKHRPMRPENEGRP